MGADYRAFYPRYPPSLPGEVLAAVQERGEPYPRFPLLQTFLSKRHSGHAEKKGSARAVCHFLKTTGFSIKPNLACQINSSIGRPTSTSV
jgi:hypothetical protein